MKYQNIFFVGLTIIIASCYFYIYFQEYGIINIIAKSRILDKMIYKTNIFPSEKKLLIKQTCDALFPFLVPDNSSATNRQHVIIEKNSQIEQIFYGGEFLSYLEKILSFKVEPCKRLPIEFRYYGVGSKMKWHRDVNIYDYLYGHPQIELVYTISNISNSKTEWIDDATGVVHKIHSSPNSIMITQGGSVLHQVTPITIGDRTIIKVAYDVSND